MSNIYKNFTVVFVFGFLMLLLVPNIVNADTSSDSNINCKLTTISPDNSTIYVGTMPLRFTMDWQAPYVALYVNMSYRVDEGPKISIADGNNPTFNSTAQSTYDHYEYVPFSQNTTSTSVTIDVSSLTSGVHKLTIFADGFYNVNGDFINNDFTYSYDFSSPPIYFSVNYLGTYPTTSPSPTLTLKLTSTPTVPEFPALIILVMFTIMMAVVCLSVYFKRAEPEE